MYWFEKHYVISAICHIHLLTYFTVQSPSWEANCFAASQEIPRISWNPKVNYHTHKRPLPVPVLGQPNPVHTPTSHLLDIHPNIIHLSTPRSPQWSLSLRFPHQDPMRPPLLTYVCFYYTLSKNQSYSNEKLYWYFANEWEFGSKWKQLRTKWGYFNESLARNSEEEIQESVL